MAGDPGMALRSLDRRRGEVSVRLNVAVFNLAGLPMCLFTRCPEHEV